MNVLRIVIFLVLAIGLSTPAFSQCNPWRVEVCDTPQPYNPAFDPTGCLSSGCYRVYYYFYLSTGSTDLTSDVPFTFTSLSINGLLAVTPGSASPPVGLSQVNVKESVACSPANVPLNQIGNNNSPTLDYDVPTRQISYYVSSTPGQSLTWPVYGRRPLFVLAIDVFAGETVDLASFTCTFTTPGSGVSCSNQPVLYCTNPLPSKTIAQPTTECSYPPNFIIGSPIPAASANFPNRQKVPVWAATAVPVSWNEVDFLMAVSPDPGQAMFPPTIESGKFSAEDVKVYLQGGQYRVYAHSNAAINIPAGSTTPNANDILFYLVFDGPLLESECAKVLVKFAIDGSTYGRLSGPGYACCKPSLQPPANGAVTVQWGTPGTCLPATAHCSNVTLEARPNPATSTTNCGSVLYFDLYANSTEKLDLYNVRLVLRVKKNGSFTLNTTLSTSPYCSSIASCVSITEPSPDYLRITYNVSGLSNLSVNGPEFLATIALNTSDNGCISGMTFLDAVVTSSLSANACLAGTHSEFSDNLPADDICATGHIFEVSAEREDGTKIEGWDYYVNYKNPLNFSNCQYNGNSADGETKSRCVCLLTYQGNPKEQNVVLKKADNYLNGVTTYDLVLISKHILGIQALPGFKILAGDANTSGSLNSTDIVELRRLILGINNVLLNANSWRFIDKDLKAAIDANANPFPFIHPVGSGQADAGGTQYSLITTPYNIFADEEFDEFFYPPNSTLNSNANFVGFKVGDVNGNAVSSFDQAATDDRSATALNFGTKSIEGQIGTTVEIPVFSLTPQSLIGWQMALEYDTNLLEVKGVRWPTDLPYRQDRGWHIKQPGELRLLWFAAEGAASTAAGLPLFFVQAELRRTAPRHQPLLQLATNTIPQEAYGAQQEQYALRLESSEIPLLAVPATSVRAVPAKYQISAYPNPAGTNFRIEIEASQAAATRLVVHDLMGRVVIAQPLDLFEGLTTIPATQLPALVPGQYIVTLYTPTGVETLRLVRR